MVVSRGDSNPPTACMGQPTAPPTLWLTLPPNRSEAAPETCQARRRRATLGLALLQDYAARCTTCHTPGMTPGFILCYDSDLTRVLILQSPEKNVIGIAEVWFYTSSVGRGISSLIDPSLCIARFDDRGRQD